MEIWYGGGIIDLRSATIAPEGARLIVRVLFGGAQLAVPVSWNVTRRISGMGGISDARSDLDPSTDAPELTIEGFVLLGGFDITDVLSPDAERRLDEAAPA